MQQCDYCLEYKLEDGAQQRRPEPKRKLLFPDGRKLQWSWVCMDCVRARHDWEQKRNVERFQEAERRRQWHKEVAERREQKRLESEARQREADLAKLANIEAQIGMMLKSREAFEAQMALLAASRDKLRKKYFSNDVENHLTPTK